MSRLTRKEKRLQKLYAEQHRARMNGDIDIPPVIEPPAWKAAIKSGTSEPLPVKSKKVPKPRKPKNRKAKGPDSPKRPKEEKGGNTYKDRDNNLRLIGFRDYAAYLASDLWKTIRVNFLHHSTFCVGCGARPTHIHHGRYQRRDLLGETHEQLYAVCYDCHRRCEFDDVTGRKLTIDQATAKLKTLSSPR